MDKRHAAAHQAGTVNLIDLVFKLMDLVACYG